MILSNKVQTLNDKNIELIRKTVVETVDVLVSDPDFGLVLKSSFKKEIAKRLKSYSKSKLTPLSTIKNRLANA